MQRKRFRLFLNISLQHGQSLCLSVICTSFVCDICAFLFKSFEFGGFVYATWQVSLRLRSPMTHCVKCRL